MAAASVALATARTLLNDDAATLWTDSVLLPKLQEAHREMQVKLELGGLPVFRQTTAIFTVVANITDLSAVAGYPTDMIEPISMREKPVGASVNDFVDMQEVDYIPDLIPQQRILYWCWRTEKIFVLASTSSNSVALRYTKGLTVPASGSAAIGFINGELYLGARTAALAAASVGNKTAHDELTEEAMFKFDMVLRMNQKGQQNLPARRRPYHRSRAFGWYV